MRIEHLALWTNDLERTRLFYVENFNCTHGALYTNPKTGFSSYFLSFTDGARLEIMTRPNVSTFPSTPTCAGYAHFAVSLGSEQRVREVTEGLRAKGVPIISDPRRTSDGYFESVVSDPDGNLIELTV